MDVLALRETHVRPGEWTISGFVAYQSVLFLRKYKYRASVYVRDKWTQDMVDLSALSSYVGEYAGAIFRYGDRDTTVVLVYERPRSQHLWDRRDLMAECQKCTVIIVCGYFNAHQIIWGSQD